MRANLIIRSKLRHAFRRPLLEQRYRVAPA